MKSICVFCGSSSGNSEIYTIEAKKLAASLVREGITLVYGGARVGLMGAIADEVLSLGGEVIGVIPRSLFEREVAHSGLTELKIVNSMHERKNLMQKLSEAFIAMPGGLGTIEEIFEMFTWAQLGLHRKPCAFLNTNAYYKNLIEFLGHAVNENFLKSGYRDMIIVSDNPDTILQQFRTYQPPLLDKAKLALGKG